MISIWEQESFSHFDVIIVGAGISGLSTAASLKEKQKNLDILVIERGTLPTGASTKNAGFACFGSISELIQDQKTLGDEGMVRLVQRRWQGLQRTISRLGEERIGFEPKGGYELLDSTNSAYINTVDEVNALLSGLFDQKVFSIVDKSIAKFGFSNTSHLIFNQYEGQLHTGKLMKSLWKYCGELGIQIITGTQVTKFEPDEKGLTVFTREINFTAKSLALCTNAFTRNLVKQNLDIQPGRGTVMIISPSEPLRFQGTFHFDQGYYYFRDFEGKLIFGGGRNLDLEGEQTFDLGINEKILEQLHKELKTRILPNYSYTVDLTWSGIMAFGETKRPIVEELAHGIFVGVRLGGMGVAIGSLVGEELSEMILTTCF